MTEPYYADEKVTLYHGDCRAISEWLQADVLVTDPPYGIGWKIGVGTDGAGAKAHAGIANDEDTSHRDFALALWGERPAAVFGSFDAPPPQGRKQTGVYVKPRDSGVVGSVTGLRRDVDPIYLCGTWPVRKIRRSSVFIAVGGSCNAIMRTGHPHTKPLDVMEAVVDACPPGVIADPFAGSGSTLLAARNLGRRVIGVELEERYCEVIAKRLAQDCLDLSVLS